MSLLRAVTFPWCTALLAEPADAPPGRYHAAWRSRGGYRWLLGQGVVDEFGTVSSPVFLAPPAILGAVYDAGLGLAFRRDVELPLYAGWPPLCLGVEPSVDSPAGDRGPAPKLPADFEERLLESLAAAGAGGSAEPPAPGAAALVPRIVDTEAAGDRLSAAIAADVVVVATDAPLLPHQLGRLAEIAPGRCSVALSTGNRLTPDTGGRPVEVAVASEARLERLVVAAAEALG